MNARHMFLRYFPNRQKDTIRTNSTTLFTDVIILLRSDISNQYNNYPLNLEPSTVTIGFRVLNWDTEPSRTAQQ